MKIKTGKLIECFAFLPSLNLSWVRTCRGTIHILQFGWLYWYIQVHQNLWFRTTKTNERRQRMLKKFYAKCIKSDSQRRLIVGQVYECEAWQGKTLIHGACIMDSKTFWEHFEPTKEDQQ